MGLFGKPCRTVTVVLALLGLGYYLATGSSA
eukprot:SAG11_NODE_20769_length_438_cov_1.362832_2_plen_30_part_01